MSQLQRSFAKHHLSQLPPEPVSITAVPQQQQEEEEEDEEGKEDEDVNLVPPVSPNDSSSSASSTGTIVPSPSRKLFEKPKG
jgi:protein phosphatase methylesterase 1